MRKPIILSFILILMLPLFSDAQRWKIYRRQFVFGAGATNFLGDLGGGKDEGRDGPYDLDFAATRPSLIVGYRYQLNSYLFLRGNVQWGILKGSDEFAKNDVRLNRNLSFRTGFFEANFMGEFYMVQNAKGNLYNLRGVRGKRGLGLDVYLFGGIGLMYFNPKAQIDNQWVALQPLGTEGQGLPGQPDNYNRITLTIPYGIGIGKTIDRFWMASFELTMRHTFTDYIDDVSGRYYGRDQLRADKITNGSSPAEADLAARLSDRNTWENIDQLNSTDRRGKPDNDYFLTGMFTLSRKIVKKRRSRPKF